MKFSHVPNHLIAIFHFLKFYFEVSYTFYSFENLHFASVIPVILVLESSQLKVFHLLLLTASLKKRRFIIFIRHDKNERCGNNGSAEIFAAVHATFR